MENALAFYYRSNTRRPGPLKRWRVSDVMSFLTSSSVPPFSGIGSIRSNLDSLSFCRVNAGHFGCGGPMWMWHLDLISVFFVPCKRPLYQTWIYSEWISNAETASCHDCDSNHRSLESLDCRSTWLQVEYLPLYVGWMITQVTGLSHITPYEYCMQDLSTESFKLLIVMVGTDSTGYS
jgi:hypothetical protein